MEALLTVTSRVAIIPGADIDTDIIFPARFLLITAGVGSLVMASALRHRGETATATTP